MSRQARAVALLCSAILVLLGHSRVRAETLTTQPDVDPTAHLDLMQTDFGGATGNTGPALSLGQFDTQSGTRALQAVDLTFKGTLLDKYNLSFVTPATMSITVGSGNPLTPGPQISLINPATGQPFEATLPDGTTSAATIHTPTDPNFWTRTVTYGNNPGENMPQKFSSDYNPSDPAQSKFYLAPANSTQSMDLKITSPSDIAQFIGSQTLQLPVAGNAFSSFMSTSGNGSGTVLTTASADVSVTYEYVTAQPEFVPEPGAVLIWGLGGIGSLVIWRALRRV
jgi:hypothetical protein